MKNLTTQLRPASLLFLILLACTTSYGQLSPSGDAYTNTASPTTNYGASKLLDVESSQTTYIQFDLSSIPAGYSGSNITKATLKLYVNTATKAGSFNVDYVSGAWSESTITANLAPALGTTIQASVPIVTADKNQYILIDITAAVQAWLNGTANDGIALVGNSPVDATFDSKESTTTSHPPELDIVFAGGGGSGITGITTAVGSGLIGGGTSGTLNLSLTNTCAKNQMLQWSGTAWACASAGTGTITGVTAGTDLTGGGTSGNVTLSLNTAATNALYAQLGAVNTFASNQTVNGTLTATSSSTGVSGSATATTGNASGVLGEAQSTSGYGVQGLATAATGTTYGVYGGTVSPAGYGVYGQQFAATGTTAGVYGTTASTTGFGVEGQSPNAGVYGLGTSSNSIGVYGVGPQGVWGATTSPGGTGVVGVSVATTGTGYGMYGTTQSPGGYGVYGVNDSSTGTAAGVFGSTASTAGFGVEGAGNVGVYGVSGITSIRGEGASRVSLWGDTGTDYNVAVLGTADNGYAGTFSNNSAVTTLQAFNETTAVGADVFSASMPGLLGDASATIGDAGCGTGFMALQIGRESMSGCNNYTLMGDTSGNTYVNAATGGTIHLRINNQDALSAVNGSVSIRGNFSVSGTKNFRIDHPLDPANKYLYHASIESSEVLNLYSGNAVLDDSGEAVVQLPDWFEVINKDFRYQLTNIGGFAPVYIAEEVSGGHFKIAGGKPGAKVSWQVSGVRNDVWEKAHPMEVEADKGADRGHYLTPELYGAPEIERIGYMPVPPGSEQIVHPRPALPRRSNASPAKPRTPLSQPMPQMPGRPKAAPLPHPVAQASRAELN